MKKSVVTLHDVAREAGVSIATVSRVINEQGYLSQTTKQKVSNAINRLGYRVHSIARELKSNKSTTIGLLIADIANPFYATLAEGVLSRASELGYKVILSATGEQPDVEAAYLDTLLSQRVAGVLAVPTAGTQVRWDDVVDFGTEVVLMDRKVDGVTRPDVIVVDNENGSLRATEYLIAMGHTRIGIISGPLSVSTGRARFGGYSRAHLDAGLEVDQDLVHLVSFRGGSGYAAAKALFSLPHPPTAIFTGNNVLGVATLFVTKELGLRIPDDLSLVVFDDVPWTRLTVPEITVVQQPTHELGRQAMSMLYERLSNGRDKGAVPGQIRVLPTELIVRSSCVRPTLPERGR